jgi:hypothetical protein
MPSRAHISIFTVLFAALFPFAVFAETTFTAGFAAMPVWVSSANPTDGDTLKLFAVVNNTSSSAISGAVSFSVDGSVVGSADVSLAISDAKILSVPWTAISGAHTISAVFNNPTDKSGNSVPIAQTIAGPLAITVAAAPPKPVVLQYLDKAVAAAGSVALPALSEIATYAEGVRQNGENYFAAQLNPELRGKVLSAETNNVASGTPISIQSKNGLWTLFSRLGEAIFKDPIYFYPFILIFGFLVLWIFLRLFSSDR